MIDMQEWETLDRAGAERLAARAAERAGAGWFAVHRHEYAGRTRWTAQFDVAGERYNLVPGGEIAVGHDAARFRPTAAQVEDFAESAAEWDLEGDIQQFVDQMTSPRRAAEVPALLVATQAGEAGVTPVDPADPRIAELVADHRRTFAGWDVPQPPGITWAREARVTLGPDWTITGAWLLTTPTYAEEVRRLAESGRRLPTPDEWEHACGAGATTLFRWGDSCPTDRDPHTEQQGPHRLPNAFGLAIAQDPYRPECTADRSVECGGDGGSMICGGIGAFASWLTIATAFRLPEHVTALDDGDRSPLYMRPVIPLD